MILDLICYYTYCFLRPLLKWFLRKTTKLCELQRVCYGHPSGAPRTLAVEYSLEQSKTSQIKEVVKFLNEKSENQEFIGRQTKSSIELAVVTVIRVKKIHPTIHNQFIKSFGRSVEQIWGYRQLKVEVEELRRTAFDSSDPQHEELLLGLWRRLNPDIPLEARVTKQWQNIGFQGRLFVLIVMMTAIAFWNSHLSYSYFNCLQVTILRQIFGEWVC